MPTTDTTPIYFRVSPSIWRHRSWTDDMRLLALYLLTSPHRTLEGLFVLPKGYICGDLQWSMERLAEPFAGLLRDGFLMYDETEEVCFLVKALKYQAPSNPNMDTAGIRRIATVPESALDEHFLASAQRYAQRFAKELAERLPQRFGKSQLCSSSTQLSSALSARAREAAVDNSDPAPPGLEELGEEQAPEEQEQCGLDAQLHNPPCDDGTVCPVRICEPPEELATGPGATLAMRAMACYICKRCQSASSGPGVTMADRQPICVEALTEYVDSLLVFHDQKPIRSLPAYLRTRFEHMTEAPVSDELLAKLRALEHRKRGPEKCEEPRRLRDVLPDIPIKAGAG